MSETKDWRKICAACHEGEPPKDCEYYGEPNGCNSPKYGEHPTHKDSLAVGNMAAMRTALEKFSAVDLSRLKFPLDGDSSAIYNSDKKEITIPYWRVAELLNEVKVAQDMAKSALSEPLRNCDVGTAEEQEERYLRLKREYVNRVARCPMEGSSFFPDSLYWAQMPYEEVK